MNYELIRSAQRKTIGLEISCDARLIVRAPWYVSQKNVESMVARKKHWIEKTMARISSLPKPSSARYFQSGESFLYRGKAYPLRILSGREKPFLWDPAEGFLLEVSCQPLGRQLFETWYRNQALDILSQKAKIWASVAGVKFTRIRINGARSRWGSCSTRRSLNFSWRVIMAPEEVIDYIVIHEIAHLLEPNHSKKFWEQVARLDPGYEDHEKWLRIHGGTLTF